MQRIDAYFKQVTLPFPEIMSVFRTRYAMISVVKKIVTFADVL